MSDYAQDIPLDVAHDAHRGTSFVPEKRAEQERTNYANILTGDLENLSKLATTDEKRATLAAEFERYRTGYRSHYLAYLRSRAGMMSTMIAGPSNFPVRRQEKMNRTERKRSDELVEFRRRALEAIRKTLCPEAAPIMAGDSDAVERLRQAITEAEAEQERRKEVNRAYVLFLKDPASLDAAELRDKDKDFVRRHKPEFSFDRLPFPPYSLTNNSANIRRMKKRLEQIVAAKATPAVEVEGTAARLEDCPADNRVRLFFPGKPDVEVRTRLKSSGFRWTPSLGCWQAYRNTNAMATAQEVAGAKL